MKHHLVKLIVITALVGTAARTWAGPGDAKTITAVSAQSISVGKKHSEAFRITAATVVNLNGGNATASALKVGMKASVVAADDGSAASIAATEVPFKDQKLKNKHLAK